MDQATTATWLAIVALVILSLIAYYFAIKMFRNSDGKQYDFAGVFGFGLVVLGLFFDAIGVILYLILLAP